MAGLRDDVYHQAPRASLPDFGEGARDGLLREIALGIAGVQCPVLNTNKSSHIGATQRRTMAGRIVLYFGDDVLGYSRRVKRRTSGEDGLDRRGGLVCDRAIEDRDK